MLAQQGSLTFKRTVQAEQSEVFRAFTTPGALQSWLCNTAQVDARKEGPIFLWWDDAYYTAGTFTELSRNESLAFTWRGPDDQATGTVQVSLTRQDGGTAVTVTHKVAISGRIEELWESGLENLQSVLETGVDLRLARRPMFGIFGGAPLDEEVTTRLGVPVREGMLVGGTVDGLAAHNAGIRKDDVVVSLAGYEITSFQSLGGPLRAYQAGDNVPVTFYRGPEQHTVTVELSRRPTPDLPATAAAAAERAGALYNDLSRELEQAIEGATEEEAAFRPSPDVWNAKEILAHLIASYRDTQWWMAAASEDAHVENPFHANTEPRLGAIVAAYTTLPRLMEELKRSEGMIVAMAAGLPEEVAHRKYLFNQLAGWLTTFDTHTREHIGEVRALLEAARR